MIYVNLGNLELAREHLTLAIEMFEKIKSQIASVKDRESYSGTIDYNLAYLELIDVLIKLGRFEDAFNMLERAKSRAILDVLGSKLKIERNNNRDLYAKQRELRIKISNLTSQIEEIQ